MPALRPRPTITCAGIIFDRDQILDALRTGVDLEELVQDIARLLHGEGAVGRLTSIDNPAHGSGREMRTYEILVDGGQP